MLEVLGGFMESCRWREELTSFSVIARHSQEEGRRHTKEF